MPLPRAPFQIRILLCRYERHARWNYPNLSAPYWRFYWNDRPGWSVRLEGRETRLMPDSFYLIPPDTPFESRSARAVRQFYIHFQVDGLQDRRPKQIHAFKISAPSRTLLKWAIQSGDEVHESSPVKALGAQSLCAFAMACLPEEMLLPRRYPDRVEKAMNRMEAELRHPIGNTLLARESGMNTNAFIRLFQKEAGISPQAYYKNLRLDQGSRLLHHTEMSIETIAEETGFFDRAHFSKVFKQKRGISPAAFQKSREHSLESPLKGKSCL